VLTGAAILFVLVDSEIVLQLGELHTSSQVQVQCAGAGASLNGQKGLFQLDGVSGFSMRPNVCVRLRSPEYDQVLHTNSRGFVGPETPDPKPVGEFRIVVLGDSYTAGGQVPYEQDYTAVLEQELQSAGYTGVRVINAGVGGCGTYCQAGTLRENVGWMQPDLVVVSVFVGNNINENVLAVHGGYRAAPEHPKGVTWAPAAGELLDESAAWFPQNGHATEDAPPPWYPTERLPEPVGNAPPGTPPYVPPSASSDAVSPLGRIRQEVRGAWEGARLHSLLLGDLFGQPIDPSVTTAPGALPPSSTRRPLNLASFEWLLLRKPPRTYWLDVAWPLFGRYLADIRGVASSQGARTVVMVIPQMGQFDDEMRERSMSDYRFQNGDVEWDQPQAQVRSYAEGLGVPELDLLPAFRARSDRAQLYLRADTHFSALGHQVVADELATFLQGSGLLPASRVIADHPPRDQRTSTTSHGADWRRK
jgi:lysophospholipase L1-like esterase